MASLICSQSKADRYRPAEFPRLLKYIFDADHDIDMAIGAFLLRRDTETSLIKRLDLPELYNDQFRIRRRSDKPAFVLASRCNGRQKSSVSHRIPLGYYIIRIRRF